MQTLAGVDGLFIDLAKKKATPQDSSKDVLRRSFELILKVVLVSLVIFIAWSLLYIGNGAGQAEIIRVSCTDAQPLASIRNNFLPADIFKSLSESLPSHPLISNNNLSENSFNSTRGWVLKFNRNSVYNITSNPFFQLTAPFLDRILIPEANAFVFNLLICKESSGKIAVKPHFDNTVGLKAEFNPQSVVYLAHQVNVLYTNIPDDLNGGELELWALGSGRSAEDGKVLVHPAENLMVAFRGDVVHQVKGFDSPSGKQRISLVLEQYKLPDSVYYQTIPYCENEGCDTALRASGLRRLGVPS